MKYRAKPIIIEATRNGDFYIVTDMRGQQMVVPIFEFEKRYEPVDITDAKFEQSPCIECPFDPMLNMTECTDCKKYEEWEKEHEV